MILLRVVAPRTAGHSGFVAGIEIIKDGDIWCWGRCAPIMRWMKDRPVEEIGKWLKGPAYRKGWRYSFHRVDEKKLT